MNKQAGQTALHPLAQKISENFTFENGQITMPKAQALAWLQQIKSTPDAQRKELSTHLIILAQRLAKDAGEAAKHAVFLLTLLVAELMGGASAADLVQKSGLNKILGQQGLDYEKMLNAPPENAVSMLGFLGNKKSTR